MWKSAGLQRVRTPGRNRLTRAPSVADSLRTTWAARAHSAAAACRTTPASRRPRTQTRMMASEMMSRATRPEPTLARCEAGSTRPGCAPSLRAAVARRWPSAVLRTPRRSWFRAPIWHARSSVPCSSALAGAAGRAAASRTPGPSCGRGARRRRWRRRRCRTPGLRPQAGTRGRRAPSRSRAGAAWMPARWRWGAYVSRTLSSMLRIQSLGSPSAVRAPRRAALPSAPRSRRCSAGARRPARGRRAPRRRSCRTSSGHVWHQRARRCPGVTCWPRQRCRACGRCRGGSTT
mmetsp:Transcript_78265/g.242644  ORF Transcript_78265/g.242644 Transcript_78265/m.242644 type:complete len:290 (+) Transcript_78265:425-1294(+)